MKVCVLAFCFSAVAGVKIVNDGLSWCMDLKSPCVDGKERNGCERVTRKDLKKGTDLQMYKCHGKHNQEFEFHDDGRIRNPVTGLCVDIEAPCKDGSNKTSCARAAVHEIKGKANVQLWTCHEDGGRHTNSFGNQKWTLQVDGTLKNSGSGLCIEVKEPQGEKAPVHARNCSGKANQVFELETRDVANKNGKLDNKEEKFTLMGDAGLLSSSVSGTRIPWMPLIGGCIIAGVASLFMRKRDRREFYPEE